MGYSLDLKWGSNRNEIYSSNQFYEISIKIESHVAKICESIQMKTVSIFCKSKCLVNSPRFDFKKLGIGLVAIDSLQILQDKASKSVNFGFLSILKTDNVGPQQITLSPQRISSHNQEYLGLFDQASLILL